MKLALPIGIESFEKLRENQYYYVDKTGLIKELLEKQFEAQLITRPRRFGKTLTMSMLADFFDISRNSAARFAGLEISKEKELCREWQNQWPVFFLTLKDVEGSSFRMAQEQLTAILSDFCISRPFLSDSRSIHPADRALAARMMEKSISEEELRNSIYTLSRMLSAHYGKPVILLIDEYDVPLAKASENGYYEEMLDLLRALLGKAIKTNEFLKFTVLTGCLRIAKESIFTGMNNLVTDTISGDRFSEYIGFTPSDVEKLLEDTGFTNHKEELRRWYDGYRFGSSEIYCPWDVLNHVNALQDNPCRKPENYWGNTSHNGVIYRFISRTDLRVNHKFEILMAGGTICETIVENLTYDTLKSSEQNLWSLLYLTGYLTRACGKGTGEQTDDGRTSLRIPNEEVKAIFKTAIVEWFQDSVRKTNREALFEALWNGDEEKAQEEISNLLFRTISYHDYQESYYHAFLAGLFSGAGYLVESNFERGTGRPDIVVLDMDKRRALVLEAKHAKSEGGLQEKCAEAIKQIRDKRYLQGIDRGYRSKMGYGIAFFEKECKVWRFKETAENDFMETRL